MNQKAKKLFFALLAPIGIALIGLAFRNKGLLIAGLGFFGLILMAAILRRLSSRLSNGLHPPYVGKQNVFERNPYLPLIMDCPKTGKTFRIGVNSATWEDSDGGSTTCPICHDSHIYNKKNTRTVSFEDAKKFP